MKLPSRNTLKWIGLVIVTSITIIVILQNTENVQTHVLWIKLEMPRVVLLFLTFMIGILVGALGARYYKLRSDREGGNSKA